MDLLLQYHLVESANEESIQEPSVEDSETNYTANELEVVQVLWIDTGMRVDLKGVVVVSRVLEEAVEGIEHLVRQEEEEFSVGTSIVGNTAGASAHTWKDLRNPNHLHHRI